MEAAAFCQILPTCLCLSNTKFVSDDDLSIAKIPRTSGETHLEHLPDFGDAVKNLVRKFRSLNQTNSGLLTILGNKRHKYLIKIMCPGINASPLDRDAVSHLL
jgi:hypothetical protein